LLTSDFGRRGFYPLDVGSEVVEFLVNPFIATVNVIDSVYFSDSFCLESCKDKSSGSP